MITNEEMLEWINAQPLWVRSATIIYCNKGEILESDIVDLADNCFELNQGELLKNINLIARGSQKSLSIKKIDQVKGVNAIDSNKPLIFGEKGITVVYGNNGVGKSGYIRILKMVAGAKYREDIKGNIYSKNKVASTCTITIGSDDEADAELVCDLNTPGQYSQLRNIDIFDTKISQAYVSESKEATYEPWIFSLFSTLAFVAARIKDELEKRKMHYIVKDYCFNKDMQGTDAYKKVMGLSHKSKISDFPSVWSEEDEIKLKELVAKCQAETNIVLATQYETEIKNLQNLIDYLKPYSDFFKKQNIDIILKLKKAWNISLDEKKAVELLFTESAENVEKVSVSNKAWVNLWKSARQYYDQVLQQRNEKNYVEAGGICPLCRQEIDESKVTRMANIDDYINGHVADKEKLSREEFEKELEKLKCPKTEKEIELIVENAGVQEVKTDLFKLNKFVVKMFNDIKIKDYKQIETTIPRVDTVIELLEKKRLEKNSKRDEYLKIANADEQKKLQQQVIELEAQKYLVSIYGVIEKNINSLVKLNKIEQAIKLTATNRFTTKSKELAKDMITDEYIRRFNLELHELTNNSIAVQLTQQRGGKGKIPYKVVLCDITGNEISPQEVLSEGENRVVSLAAFFAEASGREENCPLIVDDPISSLDYSYESKVIERLVEAAKIRQVIVFTHRISMVVGINEAAKKSSGPINYNEVTLLANKNKKGVPAEISNYGGKVLSQLNNLIDKNLSQLKKTDEFSANYEANFHYMCQQFRIIVEKSVEDVLLGEVVKRFRRDIQTKNRIDKLAQITKEDCEIVDRMMTKYSYYDHSMSDETPLIEFTIDELEKDMMELRDWIKKKK